MSAEHPHPAPSVRRRLTALALATGLALGGTAMATPADGLLPQAFRDVLATASAVLGETRPLITPAPELPDEEAWGDVYSWEEEEEEEEGVEE